MILTVYSLVLVCTSLFALVFAVLAHVVYKLPFPLSCYSQLTTVTNVTFGFLPSFLSVLRMILPNLERLEMPFVRSD